MPHMPASADLFTIPNWAAVHPDLHARWISTKPDKLRGHMWNFGLGHGAYVPYGTKFTKIEELKEAAIKLGLSEIHVDTASMQIKIGDVMLAYITREEHELRQREKLQAYRDREEDAVNAYLASERRGIKPRVFESEEEYKDVRTHATRETTNRVGYRGARAAR